MIDFDKIDDLSFMIDDFKHKKQNFFKVYTKKNINIRKKRSFNVKLERKRFGPKNSSRNKR
jgi:hypothetical protein